MNPAMMGSASVHAAPGIRYDPETEARLDQWVEAKRNKDFAMADAIRDEMRSRGIEPDRARPSDKELQRTMQVDAVTEAKLDQWVQAKRDKDFATADAIRAEMRAVGLEPDFLRPPDFQKGPTDAATEARLDQWVQAKRDKDFATADAIRAELRLRGIEPDKLRPSDKEAHQQAMAWPGGQMQGMPGAFNTAQYGSSMIPDMMPPPTPPPAVYPQGFLADQETPTPPPAVYPQGLLADQETPTPPPAVYPPGFAAAQTGNPMMQMSTSVGNYDAETEVQLDQWVQAKREKDFTMADAIRELLRAKGVEPDQARPSGKGQPQWSGFVPPGPCFESDAKRMRLG